MGEKVLSHAWWLISVTSALGRLKQGLGMAVSLEPAWPPELWRQTPPNTDQTEVRKTIHVTVWAKQ